MGCWDESTVRENKDVLNEYRKKGQNCHWGRVFSICVEKGSELEDGAPGRKYKGRVAFQGNEVR